MDHYLKNRKIRKTQHEIEPEEVFLDSLARQKESELGISEKKLETPLSRRLLQSFFIIFFAAILFLFGRTFQLQVIEGEELLKLSQENEFIMQEVLAERGVIYDRDFNQLVANQPSFALVCDRNNLPADESGRDEVLSTVSRIIGEDLDYIRQRIEASPGASVLLSPSLEHQALIILKTKIGNGELPGFQIKDNTVRNYQNGPIFAHIIGYQRPTGEKTGLEAYYDQNLNPDPGEILIERDALGRIISKKIVSLPEPGQSLVLWLDSGLQRKAEEALKKAIQNAGAKIGSVVALDPKTGGVLALVSQPSFDNNLFSKGMSQKEWQELQQHPLNPLFDRVIAGQYPTGSTIKPLIASAVLQEGLISSQKEIWDPGFISVQDKYNPEKSWEFLDWQAHGWVDIRKAIAESCNVYFYTVGGGYQEQEGLGPTRIKKYLELFGWGEPTQVDLPGEKGGLIPDPAWKKEVKQEGWWDGDTYHLSIGQGDILATPLQVAGSFAAIANGGKLLKPRVVQKIIASSGNPSGIIEEAEPEVIRENFISPENLKIVREGMRQAVSSPSGSAYLLNSLTVSAAAKTGTAETSKEGYYHNWVTVFAPYDDPQIVLTVLIENVPETQRVVLPVAQEILEWYFSRPEQTF